MAVYLLTGKLGSGKSLAAVGRAVEYLEQSRRVVVNFDMEVGPVCLRRASPLSRAVVEVLPARPGAADLRALGRGGPSEEAAGLLILDECATWLNARTWHGPERQLVIDWLLHSRKLGWDVILIVQHASALDKQVRELVCEYLVTCRRLDRFKVVGVKLPRVHVASVHYGLGPHDLIADRWIYRGNRLFAAYSTNWVSADESAGWHSVLSPWHTVYRHQVVCSISERLRASAWWPVWALVTVITAPLRAVFMGGWGRAPMTAMASAKARRAPLESGAKAGGLVPSCKAPLRGKVLRGARALSLFVPAHLAGA